MKLKNRYYTNAEKAKIITDNYREAISLDEYTNHFNLQNKNYLSWANKLIFGMMRDFTIDSYQNIWDNRSVGSGTVWNIIWKITTHTKIKLT